MKTLFNFLKKIFYSNWLGYLIFYGWNVFFIITLITLEVSEQVFSELFHNVLTSYTPLEYLWTTLLICCFPIICLVVGWRWLRNDKNLLLKWFYGFQVPLSFLIIFRLAGINQVTPAIFEWFSLLLIPVLGYGLKMILKDKLPKAIQTFFTIFQITVGVGLATYLLIYIVPISWFLLITFIKNFTLIDLGEILTIGFAAFIFSAFSLLTGTLTVIFPIALFIFYAVEGTQELYWSLKNRSKVIIPIIASLILIIFLAYPKEQPQLFALKISKQWVNGEVSDKQILESETKVREGLINAYLRNYRFISRTDDKYRLIKELYQNVFETDGNWVLALHDLLINPFIYQGSYSDKEFASEYFEEIFDEPIERAEKNTIIYAMRNTFQLRSVEATLLSIDQKQVEVTDRNIDYKDMDNGVVEVTFHERYLNRTYDRQEVFYYFNLPENSVITGMWLSDDDKDQLKYDYTIAPRGAAQKLYQQIRRVRRDPSLLEQVGPYQYRLRVYPIPRRDYVSFKNKDKEVTDHPMHLTLRLLCKTDIAGKIELPHLTEKRNVFWKQNSLLGFEETEWFPKTEQVFSKSSEQKRIAFDNISVELTSLKDLPQRNVTEPFTLIIDGSYSMKKHAKEISEIIESFPFKNDLNVMVLSKGDLLILKPPFSFTDYVGNNNPMKTISELNLEETERRLVWLTDKGSYELLQQDSVYKAVSLNQQLDVIHLNGYAAIYDDAFIETVLQSGGNIYTDIKNWASWTRTVTDTNNITWQENDTRYTFEQTVDENGSHSFAPYYASRLAMGSNRNKKDVTTDDLDQLHQLAIKYSFVSPYSSMICLVDAEQKKRLEELSKKEDRFDRAVENGKISGNLNLMASPEPEEWVMILFVLAMMVFLYRRKISGLFKESIN